ncbi:DMT family transporter [Campylobacter sp. RM12654]|uniref:DMT family transporter n=1 Tax=unclassified Campylobacter TaxID=2593542 RepID=UPI003015824C|nr:DMT family transporter [Campylobacter sp. RM12637]MBZ7978567.1 DMT family transporter [Campylobacter sp. RM12654]
MNHQEKSFFLLIFAVVIWGASFLPTKWVLNYINSYELLFYRFLLASIVFFFLVKNDILKHYKNTYLYGLITGFCMAFAFIFQTQALSFTQSSNVAFLTGLEGIIAPFLCFFISKAKLSFKIFFLALLACFGMFLFSDANFDNFGKGEYLAIICAVFFALLVALNDKFLKSNDLNTFIFFQFVGSTIMYLLSALIFADLSLTPILNSKVFILILVSALVFTIFCFFAQNYAQKHLHPSKVALILLLEPISAGILGSFYGEVFTILQLLGAGLILIALAFS